MHFVVFIFYLLHFQFDFQPLLSPSILDRFLRHEKKVSSDFGTAETCVEMQVSGILKPEAI